MISRHHWYIVSRVISKPNESKIIDLKWNHITRPEVSRRAEKAPVRGHGLGLTMWKECVWWVIRCYRVDIGLLVG